MSFQGQDYIGFDPIHDVDSTAMMTDMMGPENMANVNASNSALLKNSPSRQLLMLWFVVVGAYILTGMLFRRHLA